VRSSGTAFERSAPAVDVLQWLSDVAYLTRLLVYVPVLKFVLPLEFQLLVGILL